MTSMHRAACREILSWRGAGALAVLMFALLSCSPREETVSGEGPPTDGGEVDGGPRHPARPADGLGPELESAARDHFLAVEGDAEAGERSLLSLQSLADARPDSAIIRAYLGSARLLASRRALAPWTKGQLARDGLLDLEEALRLDPESEEVRFLRVVSTFPLPAFFGRREAAEADLEWLLPRLDGAVERGSLTPSLAAAVWLVEGRRRREEGDRTSARLAFDRTITLAPETRAAAEARALGAEI